MKNTIIPMIENTANYTLLLGIKVYVPAVEVGIRHRTCLTQKGFCPTENLKIIINVRLFYRRYSQKDLFSWSNKILLKKNTICVKIGPFKNKNVTASLGFNCSMPSRALPETH